MSIIWKLLTVQIVDNQLLLCNLSCLNSVGKPQSTAKLLVTIVIVFLHEEHTRWWSSACKESFTIEFYTYYNSLLYSVLWCFSCLYISMTTRNIEDCRETNCLKWISLSLINNVITLDNLVPTDNILLVAVSITNNVWWISSQTSISEHDMYTRTGSHSLIDLTQPTVLLLLVVA